MRNIYGNPGNTFGLGTFLNNYTKNLKGINNILESCYLDTDEIVKEVLNSTKSNYTISSQGNFAVITVPVTGYAREEINVYENEDKTLSISIELNENWIEDYITSYLDEDVKNYSKLIKRADPFEGELKIKLPEGFENSTIKVKQHSGLLYILLQKKEENREPKKVNIN